MGDEDVVRAQLSPVDGDAVWPGERGVAFDDRDALSGVALHLGGVIEVADHVVAVVAQIGPVQLRGGDALGAFGFGADFWRSQQRLGRDARPVGAFSADQLGFDYGDTLSGGVQAAGGGLSGGSGPDHDGIK